jgi:hypothetical protein
MINDDLFITIIRYISLNKFLDCCCTIWRSADKESELQLTIIKPFQKPLHFRTQSPSLF